MRFRFSDAPTFRRLRYLYMHNLRRRILLVAAAFVSVLLIGTVGFMIIERAPLLD